MKTKPGNSVIESIGDYLPKNVVSSQDILKGCTNKVRFPLDRLTGIKERRMAGNGEYAIDLAIQAIKKCFEHSKYQPEDIDLVICCNISHYDEHERYTFEPSTALKLSQHFNFSHAQVFDISNACAGVFTGINLADAYLKAGSAERVLVVSGEYITHLTNTAQKEIEGILDPRMACLTLGDSGVALILENSHGDEVGFHDLQMLTLGDYSDYCVAKATDFPHGGAIMLTQSTKLAEVAIKEGAKLLCDMIHQNEDKEVDMLLTHQTSKRSIHAGLTEVNRLLKTKKFNQDNTINNLEKRGNTSSTSHIVALMDLIRTNRLHPGQKILFSVNASGVTLGGGLYTFDELPDRLREHRRGGKANGQQKIKEEGVSHTNSGSEDRVMIDSIGIIPLEEKVKKSTFHMAKYAANACLKESGKKGEDLDVLIFTGVYRDEFICEPAIAAMLAGEIKMQSHTYHTGQHSLGFDVQNGALGFLNGISVASNMINSNKAENVMILNSEIENNKEIWPDRLLDIEETGSAMQLRKSKDGKVGFSDFIFGKYPKYVSKMEVSNTWIDGVPRLESIVDEKIEEDFINCILDTLKKSDKIQQLLQKGQIFKIVAQQISKNFLDRLSAKMQVPIDLFVDVTKGRKDLFTSSIPYALNHLLESKSYQTGDKALIIGVGSGIQVGCALYQF